MSVGEVIPLTVALVAFAGVIVSLIATRGGTKATENQTLVSGQSAFIDDLRSEVRELRRENKACNGENEQLREQLREKERQLEECEEAARGA